ncbi:unnamed protein product, partial [Closterium sp. NIES-54]
MKESGELSEAVERQSKEEEKRRSKEQQRVERKRERRRARRVMLLAAQLKEALERQGKVILETPEKASQLKEALEGQGEGRQGAVGQGGEEGVWEEGVGERREGDGDGGEGVLGEGRREGQEGEMGEGKRQMGEGGGTSEGESETSEELEPVKMEYGGDKVGKVDGGGNGLGAGGSLDVEELRVVDLGQVALLLGAIEGLKEVRDLPKLMSWLGGVSQGEGGEVGRAEVDQASDDVTLGSAEVSQVLYELAIAEESEKALALLRWMEERREREWEGMSTDQRRKIVEEERAREARSLERGMQRGGEGIESRTASEGEDGVPEEIQGGVVTGAVLGAPENTQEGVLFGPTSNAYGAVVTMLLRFGRVEEAEAMVMGTVREMQEQQEETGEKEAKGQQEKGQKGQNGQQGQQGQQLKQQQEQWEKIHPPPIPIPHRVYCQLIGALVGTGMGLRALAVFSKMRKEQGQGQSSGQSKGQSKGQGKGQSKGQGKGNWKGGGTEWGKGGGKGGSEWGFKWADKGARKAGEGRPSLALCHLVMKGCLKEGGRAGLEGCNVLVEEMFAMGGELKPTPVRMGGGGEWYSCCLVWFKCGLSEIPERISGLTKLLELCIQSFWNEQELPKSITGLRRLESLRIVDCESLTQMPKNLESFV